MGAGASWTMAPIGGVGCSPVVVTWATVDGIIGCGMHRMRHAARRLGGRPRRQHRLVDGVLVPLPWVGRPVLKRRRPRHPQLGLLDVRLLWGRRVAENLELGWQRAPVGLLLTRVVQRSVRRRSVVMVGPCVPQ